MPPTREQALERIRENIARAGRHIYIVQGGPLPRYAYTVGVRESVGFELVMPGAIFFTGEQVRNILNAIAEREDLTDHLDGAPMAMGPRGAFSLRKVDPSWSRLMLLGALDYYDLEDQPAYQVVPDREHSTIDIPDMSQPWSRDGQPVWRWLDDETPLPFPRAATATTDIEALQGAALTEAARWEEGVWEIFSGDSAAFSNDEVRVVPLASLLGADPSIEPVTKLSVGAALWRNPGDAQWTNWN